MQSPPPKGARVKVTRLVHDNGKRPWPLQLKADAGHGASVVHGPFKGDWYLIALDCPKTEIGKYSRYVAVTLDEIEKA